jgi:hypothetical protein
LRILLKGIDTTGDLHAAIRAGHARQLEGIWRTVPGQRSGISWQYLLMLAGVAEVKPDRTLYTPCRRGITNVAVTLVVGWPQCGPLTFCLRTH